MPGCLIKVCFQILTQDRNLFEERKVKENLTNSFTSIWDKEMAMEFLSEIKQKKKKKQKTKQENKRQWKQNAKEKEITQKPDLGKYPGVIR